MIDREPNLYDPTDLIPTEHAALQAIFTRRIRDNYRELQGGADDPMTIEPLDSYTYMRFLSAGAFSNHFVPITHFQSLPLSEQTRFNRGFTGPESTHGFRPASRT